MSLPSGYRKLEYIQSSGTQYIDTGFKPNQDTRVVTKISFDAVASSSSHYAFGAANSGSSGMFEVSTGNNMIRLGYGGTAVTQPFPSTKPFTIDFNKNTVTVNGTAYTLPAATFTGTYSMYICDTNRGRAYRAIPAVTVYSFRIYDNGTLVRDFIPCKNASGVVGMWDDVNSVFYQNVGSGTFDAGELPKAHKVCINGVGYSATKVTMLIDGTERKAKKGRVLIDGTGYDLKFVVGIPLSDLSPGTILTLNENGSPVPFYIAKHDYESGLNGAERTLVVRKDCYDNRQWHRSNVNAYASSDIDSWLNGTYKNLLDADIRGVIGTTKIKYTPGNGNNTVGTLERAIFLLSATELNRSASWFNVEGTALEIASSLQIAYMNGSAVVQWTRSPSKGSTGSAVFLNTFGNISGSGCTNANGSRPAFTLPGTLALAQNADGTYSIAA